MSADGSNALISIEAEILDDSAEVAQKPLRDERGRLLPGQKSLNPRGGKSKRVRNFEIMLNNEHRNLDKMRELFARLRALAMGEVVLIPHVGTDGELISLQAKLKADPAFMKLYLDRLLGPAKAFDSDMDFSDAPREVLEYLLTKLRNA